SLHGHDLLVTHRRRLAQRLELRDELRRREPRLHFAGLRELGDGRDIDVDGIAKQAAQRAVWTDVAVPIEQRVEWIQANEVATDGAGPFRHRSDIAEITDTPIRPAANRIEVRDQAERGTLAEYFLGKHTSRRDDDERLLISHPFTTGV